jgi:hypothetical protein
MGGWPRHPLVHEINALPWLNALAHAAARPLTLAHVPEAEIERLAACGFDAVWLMGVWERSPRGREIARTDPQLQAAYRAVMPAYRDEDIAGSPYSIFRYEVEPALGGGEALAALRARLAHHGLRLILDFVPNHLSVDHPWIAEHPERFVQASPEVLETEPNDYFTHEAGGASRVFAHGRDPHFRGWTDTAQLDYRRAETRGVMSDVLLALAQRCDGVRCDMAMLVTREIFLRTWGGEYDRCDAEFWPEAIAAVRARRRDFLMLAEVYWDLEHRMLELGFDYAYDKRLYDRLVRHDGAAVRAHLRADFDHQRRVMRFIENHDEPRAVEAFGDVRSRAAAALVLTLPGMRLLHDGQMYGRRLKLPVQLAKLPPEPIDVTMREYYESLLTALAEPVYEEGEWHLIEPQPAWPGDETHHSFIAYRWTRAEEHRVVAVNWSPQRAQCRLPLGARELAGSSWLLVDRLAGAGYVRDGDEMLDPGLYVELPAYGAHLLELHPEVSTCGA